MGECLINRKGGAPYALPTLNSSYPADVSLLEAAGASATFKVAIATAGNPATYTYQWYVNGAAVSGATSNTYTKSGLTSSATYTVYCAVTNKAGTINSRIATLTVKDSKPIFTYSGTYQLIDDGNYHWRLKLKSSGTLKVTELRGASSGIDVFCVGGGGGGGTYAGGGGGYTATKTGVTVTAGTSYTITVGSGGTGSSAGGTDGGQTSAFGVIANGGSAAGTGGHGGNGGSGGGAWGGAIGPNAGGSDGDNGETNDSRYTAGTGQGTTTREFGESNGDLYAGGGGGGGDHSSQIGGGAGGSGGGGTGWGWSVTATQGTDGLGGGGGGGNNYEGGGTDGGNGIVIIRDAR